MKLNIPYYKTHMAIELPDRRVKAVLTQLKDQRAASETQIVEDALLHPIDSPRLSELSKGRKNILIITSDHTRPVPSRITLPLLLKEVRAGNPAARIKILIATGLHRSPTGTEMLEKFGEELLRDEEFVIHVASDDAAMVSKGTLPSGGELRVNGLVDWADLIVSEGFIEPHFFAGFSGGRKSILPGICAKDTIMYNHNAEFIASPTARTGILQDNPIHRDMEYAAKAAGLSFILNVTIDADKKIVSAFSGNAVTAHRRGCEDVQEHATVTATKADIVVTSNGGYPLDQNIYQCVKSMTAAECCVNPGGVIILISSCIDGHGGDRFYHLLADQKTAEDVTKSICDVPRSQTCPDQWQAQILARVLAKCRAVILVSRHVSPQVVEAMHMLHAATFEEALRLADAVLGHEADVVVIPDGVGVIVEDPEKGDAAC